jgi:hypothetical protein
MKIFNHQHALSHQMLPPQLALLACLDPMQDSRLATYGFWPHAVRMYMMPR